MVTLPFFLCADAPEKMLGKTAFLVWRAGLVCANVSSFFR
jgi:hypothetical protein